MRLFDALSLSVIVLRPGDPCLQAGGGMAVSFPVLDCPHTAGPAGIYACGAATIPKSPMLVSDWFGLPIQQ